MKIAIPTDLLPRDGRFGSGPSRQRPGQLERALEASGRILGTSHRQPPVKNAVARIRSGLAELFAIPDGYEILLGNGGASLIWDALAFTGVDSHAQAAVCGEFTAKAASAVAKAPWAQCTRIQSPPGSLAVCDDGLPADAYLYAHNETSTGVLSPVRRFTGAADGNAGGAALTFVDATSAAGGVEVDVASTDLYYFSPQKCFGAEGGLWLAAASPAALARAGRLAAQRPVPASLDLSLAAKNSRANQTLNTPSLVNLLLIADQAEWMLEEGGLAAMEARTRESSGVLYRWAEASDFAEPFAQPGARSNLVVTIDLDASVPSEALRGHLRANGIVDVDPYRSLGRNQIRVGTFPNVPAEDVAALTACIDYVAERMA